MFKLVRSVRRDKQSPPVMLKVDDKTMSDPVAAKPQWLQHWSTTMNGRIVDPSELLALFYARQEA